MSLRPFLTAILLVLLLVSCDKTDSEFQIKIDQEYFSNSWIHDNAECPLAMNYVPYDTSLLTLYRLRNRLDLHADGSASYAIGSPKDPHLNDAVTSVTGTWTFDPGTNTLEILNLGGELVFAFKVKLLLEDLLIMSYISIPADPEAK